MKNQILILWGFLFIATTVQAQWTNLGNDTYFNRTGNLGIGTTSPSAKVHIIGVGGANIDLKVNGRIQTGDANTGGGIWVNGANTLFMGQNGSDKIGFYNTAWHLLVHQNGNIGIGTGANTPTGKLQVNGRLVIDRMDGGGPLGTGSLLSFSSGASDVTAIQENWGLNLVGEGVRPIKVFNTSLLVGYTSGGVDYGSGNLLAAGKVGIGTTTPNAPLQFANTLARRKLVLYEEGNNDHQYYGLGIDAGATRFQIGNATAAFRFFRADNATASTEVFTVQGDGKVGVGIAAPAYPLHVSGKIGSGGLMLESNTPAINTNQAAQYLHIYNHLSGANGLKAGGVLVADDYAYAAPTKNDLIVKGKVAIGTPLASNPNNYTLAVNGQIGAKDVRVEATSATWPDYVFEQTYELPSLKEVEAYIKLHKHLKEIPSAGEVTQKGHSLGEMDVLMLKKIEELTLYMINQDKKLEAQQKEIQSLRKQVEEGK
jgi:hypothetical protein